MYKLGCKGPITYNACATTKWNDGTSFPIESGHGCIGCSEPGFWDFGGLYNPVSLPSSLSRQHVVFATGIGVAAGVAIAALNKQAKQQAKQTREPVNVDELNREVQP